MIARKAGVLEITDGQRFTKAEDRLLFVFRGIVAAKRGQKLKGIEVKSSDPYFRKILRSQRNYQRKSQFLKLCGCVGFPGESRSKIYF